MNNENFRNFRFFEISKNSIVHWLFPRFFSRFFVTPKNFRTFFPSDSKNRFLRWNLFKFDLKYAHVYPLSNESKPIEIVRVVQKLSPKGVGGHKKPRMCHLNCFKIPISCRDSCVIRGFACVRTHQQKFRSGLYNSSLLSNRTPNSRNCLL